MNFNMQRIFTAFVAITLCSACSAEPSGTNGRKPPLFLMASPDTTAQKHSLAYTHNIQVEVPAERLETIHSKIVERCQNVTEFTCAVLSSDFNHSEHPSASLSMRVSPEGVDPLISQVSDNGIVSHRSTNVDDLAEPISDLDDQIQTLSSYLADLKTLQEQSKNNVQNLIQVTSEIASTTTRLERARARQAGLADRVELQILNVQFSVDPDESFAKPIGQALADFGTNLSHGIARAITGLAYVLPWLIVLLPTFYLVRRLWRSSK